MRNAGASNRCTHTTSFIINLFLSVVRTIFVYSHFLRMRGSCPLFAADIVDEMLSVSICLPQLDGTVIRAGVCDVRECVCVNIREIRVYNVLANCWFFDVCLLMVAPKISNTVLSVFTVANH